jgi:hypothetical protein
MRIPVGTLCSDATGYVSFDLKPLIDLGLQTASGLLISAPCAGLHNYNLLETSGSSRRIEGESSSRVALPSHLQPENSPKRRPPCVVFPVHVEKPKHDHDPAIAILAAAPPTCCLSSLRMPVTTRSRRTHSYTQQKSTSAEAAVKPLFPQRYRSRSMGFTGSSFAGKEKWRRSTDGSIVKYASPAISSLQKPLHQICRSFGISPTLVRAWAFARRNKVQLTSSTG